MTIARIFIQEDMPVGAIFGDQWRVPSTGMCWKLAPNLMAWGEEGNADTPYMGRLSSMGSNLLHAIDDNGYTVGLDISNGVITTDTAFIEGVKVANANDLTGLSTDAYAYIKSKSEAMINSSRGKGNDNFCVTTGVLHFEDYGWDTAPVQLIPKPTFKDGTQPSDELTFWAWDRPLSHILYEDFSSVVIPVTESGRQIEKCYATYTLDVGFPELPVTIYAGQPLSYICFGIR
jgi:hypothetical protein